MRTSLLTADAGDRPDVDNVVLIITNGPSNAEVGLRCLTLCCCSQAVVLFVIKKHRLTLFQIRTY